MSRPATYKSLIDFAIAIEDQNFYKSEKSNSTFFAFAVCFLCRRWSCSLKAVNQSQDSTPPVKALGLSKMHRYWKLKRQLKVKKNCNKGRKKTRSRKQVKDSSSTTLLLGNQTMVYG